MSGVNSIGCEVSIDGLRTDPEYRIAYDVENRKVGCVLIQAALCGTVPHDLYHEYFGAAESWTVDAAACQVYSIRRSQLPVLAARTDFDHERGAS